MRYLLFNIHTLILFFPTHIMCYRNPYVQRFRLLVNDPKAQKGSLPPYYSPSTHSLLEYLEQKKTDLSIDLSSIINPLTSPTNLKSTMNISSDPERSERILRSSSPIRVNKDSPLLSSTLNKDLFKDNTSTTMSLIEEFNGKMKSLEDL